MGMANAAVFPVPVCAHPSKSLPSKIIGRLNKPFIKAEGSEREGYVPNVVYTCGLLQHAETLIIPYAVSDSATGFVTIELKDLLDELNFLKK